VNILLGREVMPERIQEHCTIDALYAEILPLLSDGEKRDRQLVAFEQVQAALTTKNGLPNAVAAEQVLRMAGLRTAAP